MSRTKDISIIRQQLFEMRDYEYKTFHSKLIPINIWLKSKHIYTVRFGIDMLMKYYLDDEFKEDYLKAVSEIHSNEYYVNMAIARFFATALSKQYEVTISYLKEKRLDLWVHNKTIQKAR